MANPKCLEEAEECFRKDLSFGTAGLRAEMGVGFSKMNRVTVAIASMGIAAYLKEKLTMAHIVIGYDHRHNSKDFARTAAAIYSAYGHAVKLFPRPVPTPFVPSAIQCHGFDFGVMVTASHNPKQDNGYKVYAGNGAQIVDEMAKEISSFIQSERGKFKEINKKGMVDEKVIDFDEGLLESVQNWYIAKLRSFLEPEPNDKMIRVVYTALHGVGADYVDKVFSSIYDCDNDEEEEGVFSRRKCLVHVEEQRRPDPDFPTVEFPNPEEGSSTLKMAIEKADLEGISIVFANDPDADRFCVAEKEAVSGKWRIFNGNEIANLLANFLSDREKEKHNNISNSSCKDEEDKDNNISKSNDEDSNSKRVNLTTIAMLSSCVSSRFLGHFCANRNWYHETTSTGFKNLGNRALKLKNEEGYTVLLAYEEAIGFQIGDWNFDKDGITTLMTFYALIQRNRQRKGGDLSLSDNLKEIYEAEGFWPVQYNGYYYGKSALKIKEIILEAIKSAIKVKETCSYSSFKNDGSVIKIEFEIKGIGLAWLMLRSSGTEPKLKYYSEVLVSASNNITNHTIISANLELERIVENMINVMIEPEKNQLIKKK